MGTKDRSIYVLRRYRMNDGYNGHGWEIASVPALKFIRTRTGEAVPNWRQKIQNGENATSNLTAEWCSLVDERPIYCHQRIKWSSTLTFDQDIEGNAMVYHTNLPTWQNFTSSADSQASAKFLRQVREAETKLQGLIFLGELRETLRMLRRPAVGLQDLISSYLTKAKAFSRGNGRRRVRDFNKALSQLWLEHSFGWAPLLADIADARKAYNSLFEREREVKISVGGKDFKRFVNAYGTSAIPYHCPSWYYIATSDTTDQTEIVRIRGVVRSLAVTTARDRFARFGFSPKEFIPTAWELLPWSFLVDYFANIGELLESSVTDTASVIWNSKTTVRQIDVFRTGYVPKVTVGQAVLAYDSRPGHIHIRRRTVSRGTIAGVSLPTLTFRLPSSPVKLTNMLSLLGIANSSIHSQNVRKRNYRL